MEEKFDVSPIGIRYICDSCNNGEMLPTGEMNMYENHATFIHKCKTCKNEKELMEKYPLIRYEQI